MANGKQWVCSEVSPEKVAEVAGKAGISRLLAKIFVSRGIDDPVYIGKFLEPSLDELHDPFLMKDMEKAADRILKAINDREKILVYGDYDVDGITSTSILTDFLSGLGAQAGFYIPDRVEEGYGLSMAAIDRIREQGAGLIITVDCGITAVDEIAYINKSGMDVIVTDHHECKPVLPDAHALVNPHRPGCPYPFKELAGVGVVYKLLTALCSKLGLGDSCSRYLDLVTVGTIADVVPLQGENRIIVKHGMKEIAGTSNIGLRTLIENSGIKDREINSWTVSFVLAPRINAAGRIGDAGRAVRLFTTMDASEALSIALELNDENRFRQDTEAEIFRQVTEIIESDVSYSSDKVLVIAGEAWHHGVIGIVSSKITEKYYKPSILFSVDNGTAKGSGRSIEGFNLFNALTSCGHLLERYGGHELAAGLSINPVCLPEFRRMINEYADSVMREEDLIPKVKIDVRLERDDISIDSVRELEMLAPFGAGNPSPVFSYGSLAIDDIRTVGGDRHLKLRLADGGYLMDAIGFNMGSLAGAFSCADLLEVACSLEVNTWNSVDKVQLNLKDIRLSGEVLAKNSYLYRLDKCIEFDSPNDYNKDDGFAKALNTWGVEELIPERRDLVAVYQYLKSGGNSRIQVDDLFVLAARIAAGYRIIMNYFKLKKSIEIFEELNLMKMEPLGENGALITVNESVIGKTNLDNSPLYRKLQGWKKWLKQG